MTKEEIKTRYTIEDVLKRHGVQLYGGHRCKPFCHDSASRSKNAAYNSQMYTCFVCNIHYDVIALEMELSSCDFQTACRLISGEDLTKEQQHAVDRRKALQRLEEIRKAKEAKAEMEIRRRLRRANTVLKVIDCMGLDWTNADKFAEAIAEQQKCEYLLEGSS